MKSDSPPGVLRDLEMNPEFSSLFGASAGSTCFAQTPKEDQVKAERYGELQSLCLSSYYGKKLRRVGLFGADSPNKFKWHQVDAGGKFRRMDTTTVSIIGMVENSAFGRETNIVCSLFFAMHNFTQSACFRERAAINIVQLLFHCCQSKTDA